MKRKIEPATIWFSGIILLTLCIITFFAAGHVHNQALQVEIILFLAPGAVILTCVGFALETERKVEARLTRKGVANKLVEIPTVRENDYDLIEYDSMRKCEIALACGDYDDILKGVETQQ